MIFLIIFATFLSFSISSCKYSKLDDDYRAGILPSIINSQSSSCHIHFVNKDKVLIKGELTSPLTIDTHSVNSISLPLLRMKPLICVVLLIGNFLKTKKTSISHSLEAFHHTFLRDEASETRCQASSVERPFTQKWWTCEYCKECCVKSTLFCNVN